MYHYIFLPFFFSIKLDNGKGIDKESIAKLFSMYGQASVSDFRKYGGTGIGLRLCALLVQQSMGMNFFSLFLL